MTTTVGIPMAESRARQGRFLSGVRVGFVASPRGVAQDELDQPRQAFTAAGADAVILGLEPGTVRTQTDHGRGQTFEVDRLVEEFDPTHLDALVIPGGAENCTRLAATVEAVDFVRGFLATGRPVGAICHGVLLLIAAGGVEGRQLTSWPGIQDDVLAAGGRWIDRRVVVDDNLVTSRTPDDIPFFLTQLAALLDR